MGQDIEKNFFKENEDILSNNEIKEGKDFLEQEKDIKKETIIKFDNDIGNLAKPEVEQGLYRAGAPEINVYDKKTGKKIKSTNEELSKNLFKKDIISLFVFLIAPIIILTVCSFMDFDFEQITYIILIVWVISFLVRFLLFKYYK